MDHHDKAYAWAERRKLETHPTTGAAQLVEIRERLQEIVVPAYVQQPPAPAEKKLLLAHVSDEELLRSTTRRRGNYAAAIPGDLKVSCATWLQGRIPCDGFP